MSTRSHGFVAAGVTCLMLLVCASRPARADLVFGTVRTSGNGYGFGSFDIANPTGSPGTYVYTWTTATLNEPAMADLARDPVSGDMFVMVDPYGSRSFSSISPTGLTTPLGTTTNTIYSMAFDNVTGELYAYSMTAPNTWQQLDPIDGSTLAGGSLTGDETAPYSSYGGNMSGAATGGFYFVNEFPAGQLIKITPTGVDGATVIIGTMAGTDYDSGEPSSPFVWGTTLHVLNENRVYSVNETDASLTLLGTVSGLPGDFMWFTGAVAPVAVPEPSAWVTAALGLTFGWRAMRRRVM